MADNNEIRRTVNLDGAITTEAIQGALYGNENKAHTFIISATRGGAAYPLTGDVTAKFIRHADEETIPITGSTSNDAAVLTLIENCYYMPGPFDLTIFHTKSGVKTAVYSCSGNIKRTETSVVIDPSGEIQNDVTDLLAAITAAEGSIPSDLTDIMAADAPTFTSGDYKAGQYVWYGGKLYKFAYPHSGSWTGTDVVSIPLGTGLYNADSALNNPRLMTLRGSPYIKQGYITTDTELWNNRMSGNDRCAIIPVTSGQSVSVTAGSSYAIIAALKSFNDPATGDAPDFSAATGWTANIKINATTTFTGTIPSDANYLYVWLGSTTYDLTRTPASVLINRYEYAASVHDNVSVRAMDAEMRALLAKKPEMTMNGVEVIGSQPVNVDLDDFTTPGTYCIANDDNLEYIANKPAAQLGKLFVMMTSSDIRLIQIFVSIDSAKGIYFRTKRNAGWNSWHQYALTDSPTLTNATITNATLTGTATAPTQDEGDNSTKLATTAYTDRATNSAKSYTDEKVTEAGVYKLTDSQFIHGGYFIGTDGKWTSGSRYYTLLPVTGGQTLRFTAYSGNDQGIAILRDYTTPVTGESALFSTDENFNGLIVVDRGTTVDYTLPSDAKYLYIYLHSYSNGTYSRLPGAVIIDGYDYARSFGDNFDGKASIASPTFTGNPTAPTQPARDNSTKIATTAYVDRVAPVRLRVMQNNLGKMNKGQSLSGSYHYMTTANYQTVMNNYQALYDKYQPDIIGYEEFVNKVPIYTTDATPVYDHDEYMETALFSHSYPHIEYPRSDEVSSKLAILSKFPLYSGTDGYKRIKIEYTYPGQGELEEPYAFVIYGHINVYGKRLAYCVSTMTQDDDRAKGVAKRAALLPIILNMFADDEYAIMIADVNNGGLTQSTTSLESSTTEATNLYNDIIKPAGFEIAMGSDYRYYPYEKTWQSVTSQFIGSIDNIYYKNNGRITFDSFRVIAAESTGLMSDHIPIIGDFTLL